MKSIAPSKVWITRCLLIFLIAAFYNGFVDVNGAIAQNPVADSAFADMAKQIADLRDKIVSLEAALAKSQSNAPAGMAPMSGNTPTDGMPAGDMDSMEMGSMSAGSKSMGMDAMKMGGKSASGGGMGMMDDDMDMMGMMGKGGMGMGSKGAAMKMAAALPGFPGASHIYHIGATGFFLDHPEHITLSTEQQLSLNKLKQQALLDKANSQRKIDEAEQELWELTAMDEPDAEQIETKIQEIEKKRGEQRLAFIRAVGEAAGVLTGDQRKKLLGN